MEVRLSANDNASVFGTRAAIIGDVEEVKNLGIFGLARGIQNINQQALPVTWFDTSQNWSGCILNNVRADMTLKEDGTKFSVTMDGAPYFYPISQFYSYDFYGYHPHSTTITRGTNSVSAVIDIDGTKDVLWGRTVPPTTDEWRNLYAYSAKYFRQFPDDPLPLIEFKHMLTRLVFYVVPGADGKGDLTEARRMQVDTLEISDAYTQLSLAVADRARFDAPEMIPNLANTVDQRITPLGEKNGVMLLREEDGITPAKVSLSNLSAEEEANGARLGESIMLYPQKQYTIRVVASRMQNGVRQRFITEFPLYLQALDESFERGKSYNVKITLHGPQEIELEATLEDWEEVDGPEIEL